MPNLKTAQAAFTKARAAYKTAQEDLAMPGNEKEQMAEQVIALADELVSVAVESVEGAGAGMGNGGGMGMGTPGEGAIPTEGISTDIPIPGTGGEGVEEGPDKKLNTAMGDNHNTFSGDSGKLETAKDDDDTKKEMKEMRKELDAMKAEKVHIKLAKTYSELYPLALRTAMEEKFLSIKEPTAMLQARLDEATINLAKPQLMKIAQQEDSLFSFENLDNSSNRTNSYDTGAKL